MDQLKEEDLSGGLHIHVITRAGPDCNLIQKKS